MLVAERLASIGVSRLRGFEGREPRSPSHEHFTGSEAWWSGVTPGDDYRLDRLGSVLLRTQ